MIFRDGNSVSVYKADGDSSLAVIGFCERYGFDRLENVVVPVTDIELIHFFERLYGAGCSIEKVICCNSPADKERFREYLASNGTLLEITDYNESVFAGDMKLCVKWRDYTSYFAECESGDIKRIYSTNLEKAQYAEPIDISGADIVVLNGESDTFEYGFDKEAEYFLFDHSKYSDEFKDYVKDMKIYDTADANVYIFTLNDGKISIRSMTYGI